MQLWEVVLIFVGIPTAVCVLITAIVLALTSSNKTPDGIAEGTGGRSASGDGDGSAGGGASGGDAAARSAEPDVEADGSELRSHPCAQRPTNSPAHE